VKLEGAIYVLIHVVLYLIMLLETQNLSLSTKIKNSATFIFLSVGICSIFFLYKLHLGISGMSGRLQMAGDANLLPKSINILMAFLDALFSGSNFNLLWLLLIFSILGGISRLKRIQEIKYLCLSLIAFFLIYIAFLMSTKALIDYPTTLSRIILHFFPICPMLIILLNAPLNPVLHKQNHNRSNTAMNIS
jgi:hypothetical protein